MALAAGAAIAALLTPTTAATAAARPSITSAPRAAGHSHILGAVPHHAATAGRAAPARAATGPESRVCQGCTPPLLRGDGVVMGTQSSPGENTQYAIYWTGAGSIPAAYQSTINQYLTDVAADSGRTTNVYSTDTQYTGGAGYLSHFTSANVIADTNPAPPEACPHDPGYTLCLTDAQLQQELLNVINGQSLVGAVDHAHMFLVFLPPGVEVCADPNTCSATVFCGYHSSLGVNNGSDVIYSAMPYATLQGCASGQHPSGDPYADGEIDTLSHEVNESVTDPLGAAWQDSSGNEDGDECSNIYGTPFGTQADTTNSTQYNQVINAHRYYTQEEFSNAVFNSTGAGCVQAVRTVTATASPARIPNDGTSTSAVTATVLQSTGGTPVSSDQITFSVSSASGSCGTVNPTQATTNSSGVASTTYTASTTNDSLCTVTASEVAGGQSARSSIVQGGETYHAVAPFRLADTRAAAGTYAVNGPSLSPNGTVSVPIRGQDGVPGDATAAVLNITATGGTASSFFTAFGNPPQPTASNLNFLAGQTVANLATVPISSSGAVTIYNLAGRVDVVVDLAGYMEPVPGPLGLFHATSPARITDTRAGSGFANAGATPGPNGVVRVQVLGAGSVPASGVSAVALNVTAVTPSASGFLTVYPDGTPKPTASNINFVAGEVVPNRVVVKVPAGGTVDVYNLAGSTDVVVDVVGWFTDASTGSTGALFTPLPPTRVADTRAGSGQDLEGQTVGPSQTLVVPVGISLGLPADAKAVAGNVTVVDTTAASYLTVYPAVSSRPTASDLNWVAGQVVPNQVIAAIGDGRLALYNNSGSTDVIVDISGFWS